MTDNGALLLSQRRFMLALSVSFVAHLLVLSSVHGLRSHPTEFLEPPPLEVRLVQLAPTVPAPPLPERLLRPVEKLPRPVPHAPAPVFPVLTAPPKEQPTREQTEAAFQVPAPVRVEPVPENPPLAVPDTTPPERATTPEVSAAAQEAQREGARGGFVRQLERALEANLQYPRVASMRGWQGLVKMRVQFLPGGQLGQISILRSSGYAVLDDTAMEMVRTADLPRVPDPLLKHEFTLDVPVMFRLRS